MKMNEMFPSNFLKKEDVPQPVRAAINSVTMEEVAGDNGKELKATMHFAGDLKAMILNKGNAITISEAFGDDTDAWVGKTIEIFADPGVMFGGKRVGGLRVRVPNQAAGRGATAPPEVLAARRRIAESATVQALGALWVSLPPDVQKAVLADKDRRKSDLMNPDPPDRGDSYEGDDGRDPIPF